MSGSPRRDAPRRRSWPLALAFAVLGLTASAIGAIRWQHSIRAARSERVAAGVDATVVALSNTLTKLGKQAADSVTYFSPNNPDPGDAFAWATHYVGVQASTPGMSALLYVQNVSAADLDSFTEAFHAHAGQTIPVVLAPDVSVHEIIARGQPTQVLGVDVRLMPEVQPLLDEAAAARDAVIVVAPDAVTKVLPLDKPGSAFLIGRAERDADGRVIGWGVATFSGPGLVSWAHLQAPSAFGVSVEADLQGRHVVIGKVDATGETAPVVVRTLHIDGLASPILVRVTPTRVANGGFLAAGPMGLLVSGAALALAVASVIFVIAGGRSKALKMVDDATADLLASKRRLASLVDHSADVVAIVGPDLGVRFVTPAVERLVGLPVGDVEGRRLNVAFPFEEANAFCDELLAVEPGETLTVERVLMRRDGADIVAEVTVRNLVRDDAVRGFVLTIHDVTDRKLYEQLLHHQAAHDPITGLPNRTRLGTVVESAREGAHRRQGTYAVLYVDLDRFKDVNDVHGHGVGDEVLRVVAQRLGAAVRPVDTVLRVGGDEFLVICPGADEATGHRVAQRIEGALDEPLVVVGLEVSVGASVGVVVGGYEDDPELLVLAADQAMYRAKAIRRV